MKSALRIALVFAAFAFGTHALAADLNFKPFKTNGMYALNQEVGWTVTPKKGVTPTGTYTYTVKTDQWDTIKTGRFDLSNGSATIAVKLDHPAMVYVTVDKAVPAHPDAAESAKINDALKAMLAKNDPSLKPIFANYPEFCVSAALCPPKEAGPPPHVAVLGAAVDPSQLKPVVAQPADFESFWAAKLAALRKVPMNAVLTPMAATQPGVKLYRFRLDSLNSHVHGYVALPKGKGPFPELIMYQWAGVYPLDPSWATNRAAEGWLTVDVDSHDMLPDQATAPKNYQELGDTSRETSYFLDMYLRDTRALDWGRTLAHWNRKTLVIMGTSMGGQQSLATAGLNPGKITAVIVNEPAGADADAELHGRKSGYPWWDVSNPKIAETGLYFDTVYFARHITAPTLLAVGFIDHVCVPTGVWTAFNQIPAPKEIVPMVESDHNNYTPDKQGAFLQRSEEVLATLRSGRPFVPNEGTWKGR